MIEDSFTFVKNKPEYNPNLLYLLESVNESSGFLCYQDHIVFIVKSNSNDTGSYKSDYLSLQRNVIISSVENNSSFATGQYDILFFNADIFKDSESFRSFYELCKIYVKSNGLRSFVDFFYSLNSLFKAPKENSFTNAVGMFGELEFIKCMFMKYNLNLSDNWHRNGPRDKYDFVFTKCNLDIKTTVTSDDVFLLKHDQLFNGNENYVAVIHAKVDNSGQSIQQLFNYFNYSEPFKNNLNFQMSLIKELKKVSNDDFKNQFFTISKIEYFYSKDLSTVESIPENINSLSYKFDFVGQKQTNLEALSVIMFPDK